MATSSAPDIRRRPHQAPIGHLGGKKSGSDLRHFKGELRGGPAKNYSLKVNGLFLSLPLVTVEFDDVFRERKSWTSHQTESVCVQGTCGDSARRFDQGTAISSAVFRAAYADNRTGDGSEQLMAIGGDAVAAIAVIPGFRRPHRRASRDRTNT